MTNFAIYFVLTGLVVKILGYRANIGLYGTKELSLLRIQ